ncbi:MAG: hypothetical protein RIT43_64 [Bacteroidota bacterium]|jgi:hypothetical protein
MAKIEMSRGSAVLFLLILGITMLTGPEPWVGGLMIGAALIGIITLILTKDT